MIWMSRTRSSIRTMHPSSRLSSRCKVTLYVDDDAETIILSLSLSFFCHRHGCCGALTVLLFRAANRMSTSPKCNTSSSATRLSNPRKSSSSMTNLWKKSSGFTMLSASDWWNASQHCSCLVCVWLVQTKKTERMLLTCNLFFFFRSNRCVGISRKTAGLLSHCRMDDPA